MFTTGKKSINGCPDSYKLQAVERFGQDFLLLYGYHLSTAKSIKPRIQRTWQMNGGTVDWYSSYELVNGDSLKTSSISWSLRFSLFSGL